MSAIMSECRVLYDQSEKTSPVLTIITVVKDDFDGLLKTAKSVKLYITAGQVVQYLIWINYKSHGIIERSEIFTQYADTIVAGADSGIFDAMNKSLAFCRGKYVLFLNARDLIIKKLDPLLVLGPSLLPVYYFNYFGQLKKLVPRKNIKFGYPYCHQGIILPKESSFHDISYVFGAEYLNLIEFGQWPLKYLNNGGIFYDNTGVSTQKRLVGDLSFTRIIFQKFGIFFAFRYLFLSLIKLTVKRLYDFYKFVSEVK